jgi:pyrroloquinoline quinone biosynthesis protein E
MRLFFVAPDYHEGKAKRCVNGWGSTFMTIAPDGGVLPCHTAKMLPGLAFPNVREHGLREIWFDSEGFNRYRGTGWMKEPCASCDQREVDLGGCRCQAYMLANDPAAADPVCVKSPHHALVTDAVDRVEAGGRLGTGEHPLVFRDPVNSRRLSPQ